MYHETSGTVHALMHTYNLKRECSIYLLAHEVETASSEVTNRISGQLFFTHFGTRRGVVSFEKLMVGRVGIEEQYCRETRHLNKFLDCILIEILMIANNGM
jgi:hypothetical protein